METRKLLIVDEAEEFCLALAETLQDAYHVRTCSDGAEALTLLRSDTPDVLVLDLMLPGLDGISLLQRAAISGICPVVLATSKFINDYVLDAVSRLGVGYLVRKPCDLRAIAARLSDLTQQIQPVPVQPDPKTHIANILLSLGMPPKLDGYNYLLEAIPMLVDNPRQPFTKELYPAVAKRCQCESGNVERSIRNAIDRAWQHRDDRIWQLYFPANASGTVPRPTNGTFISRLAHTLAMRENGAAAR